MSTTQSVSIIIPTLLNIKGLKYLINYFSKKTYPLIIIDNNPRIKKDYLLKSKNIIYIPQQKNLGFAKSVNLGAKKAKTEWLLILNDDVEFELNVQNSYLPDKQAKFKSKLKSFVQRSDIVQELVKFAKKHSLVATSPILVNPNGQIENMGYQVLSYGKVRLIKNPNDLNLNNHFELKIEDSKVDGLTAACLLIKRDIFLQAGGFDERFFAYLEDVDLFLTLKEKKKRFAVCPYLAVLHHHMFTGRILKWYKNWLDFKNWILVIAKHPSHFRLTNPKNLSLLLIERVRNFFGIIKVYKFES